MNELKGEKNMNENITKNSFDEEQMENVVGGLNIPAQDKSSVTHFHNILRNDNPLVSNQKIENRRISTTSKIK